MKILEYLIKKIKVETNNNISNSNIFCGDNISVFFNLIERRLLDDINQTIILADEQPYEELYKRLIETYTIPKIEFDVIREKHSGIERSLNGNKSLISSMRLKFSFNYNLIILDFSPSNIHIADKQLIFLKMQEAKTLEYDVKLTDNLIDNFEKIKETTTFIEKNIDNLNIDIDKWNNKLINIINDKLSNYNENKELFTKLYTNLKIRTNADKFITPKLIKKKIFPKPISVNETIIISTEIYNDITNTLKNVGRAIESKRRIYLDAYEKKTSLKRNEAEDYFRDLFLLFLETRYESVSATAETFNKEGKTDILLKNTIDNSNLFVAECKIWYNVEQSCTKAIEQLMGYITIHETKTALLLFVKDNNVIDKIKVFKECIKKNKYFKKHIEDEDDFSFKYILHYRDERNVEVILNVLFFHFPQKQYLNMN